MRYKDLLKNKIYDKNRLLRGGRYSRTSGVV